MQLLVPDRRLLTRLPSRAQSLVPEHGVYAPAIDPRADLLVMAKALKIPHPTEAGRYRAAKRTVFGRPRGVVNTCPGCCDSDPPPVGACCEPNGPCSIASEANCIDNIGGTYLGDGTTCAGNPCGPPPAQCCSSPGLRCFNRCGFGPGAGQGSGPVTVTVIATITGVWRCCRRIGTTSPVRSEILTFPISESISAFGTFNEFCDTGVLGVCSNRPEASAIRNETFPSEWGVCLDLCAGNPAACPNRVAVSVTPGAGPGGVPGWNWTASAGVQFSVSSVGATGFVPGCTGGSQTVPFTGPILDPCEIGPGNIVNFVRAEGSVTISIVSDGRYPCPGTQASLRGVSPADIDAARATIAGINDRRGCSGCGGGAGAGGALI